MRITIRSLAATLVLVLAGCGGGGGGSGGAAVVPATPAPGVEVPAGVITVDKAAGTIAAGATVTWRVVVADGAAGLAAFVGPDWLHADAATVTALGGGAWQVSATLPTPLPAGCALLLRITDRAGNVSETGPGAFAL